MGAVDIYLIGLGDSALFLSLIQLVAAAKLLAGLLTGPFVCTARLPCFVPAISTFSC